MMDVWDDDEARAPMPTILGVRWVTPEAARWWMAAHIVGAVVLAAGGAALWAWWSRA